MDIATRNRTIKSLLSKAFAPHTVTVRGSRGTGYGWVTVKIGYAPKSREEREQLTAKIWQIFAAAKIDIGTYGYDDPGSDYGYGRTIHLNFEPIQEQPLWTPESARRRVGGTFGT